MQIAVEGSGLGREMAELQGKYGRLHPEFSDDAIIAVAGVLQFDARYDGKEASGEYEIRITIPADFPKSVPTAFETGGRVPGKFHHYPNEALCLGAPLAVRRTFLESPTLLGFVETLLVPFLFSHAYFEEHGEMPFGQLEHGIRGLIDSYTELFHANLPATLALLRTLADGRQKYRDYLPCPCGNGRTLRQCHGEQVEGLWASMQRKDFSEALMDAIQWLRSVDPDTDLTRYLPHKARRQRNAKRRGRKPKPR